MECLFCNTKFINENKFIENKYWLSIYDGFPVTKGHVLIIPKKHINSIFDISSIRVLISLIQIIIKVKNQLVKKYRPDGFNIGINDGNAAGQTIPHLHIHVIPRYNGDGGLPCGVRNVFDQSKANYLNQ